MNFVSVQAITPSLLLLQPGVLKFFVEVPVRFALPSLLFFLAAVTLGPRGLARSRETGFLDRSVSLHGTTYKYQVFVPEDWSPKQKWPIILFLHGAGERGSDGLLQTDIGLPNAIRHDRTRFPTLVVMPQCVNDRWWTEPVMEEMALAALAEATKEFKGDPKHTYLTGLSMGGYGSWDLAARYPGKFAAVVAICGGIVPPEHIMKSEPELAKYTYPDVPKSYAEVARKIGKTPMWIFHGADDPVVPVSQSRHMAEALKNELRQTKIYSKPPKTTDNGPQVIYTEYPETGHDSWNKAYAEPALIPWILSKSLPVEP
jgi:predicted peptidase